MKKHWLLPGVALLALLLFTLSFGLFAIAAEDQTVYISASGSDENAGTSAAPYLTLDKALSSLPKDGSTHTICIKDTCAISAWNAHSQTVIIKGGTLDATGMGNTAKINDNVTFENMTLTFTANATLYANGFSVTIKESVTVTNALSAAYGGANGSTVASTDLTLLSGSYSNIFGGSNGGTVTGDTHLVVGGNVNPSADYTSHSGTYNVFGGSNNGTVGGDTHMTFTGNAKANYIWGGTKGGNAKIIGDKYATMSGGEAFSFYGGNNGVDSGAGSDNYTVFCGGKVQQLFGANQGAAMTGNVDLRATGGTVERRIYGGCYNDWNYGWASSYYVVGNIRLTLGGGVSITYSVSDNDRGVFAHSRQKTLSSTEISSLVFADATAYNHYKNKVGQQDTLGKILIMGSTSAADSIHYYTYAASGAVLTETCAYHSNYSATATLSLDGTSLQYTGAALRPAKIIYSAGWEGDPLSITYANNVNAGTATASVTRNDVTASLSFTIAKAPQAAPEGLSKTDETVKGKQDGRIAGLTTAMEYSADGVAFTLITDPKMTFAPGSYSIRYSEQSNHLPSPTVAITIAAGDPLVITFIATGSADVIRFADWAGTLTDIPAIPSRTGYDQVAPYWDTTAFDNIKSNRTVHAVYTPNRYTVTFLVGESEVASLQTIYGQGLDGALPAIPAKAHYDQVTPVWSVTDFAAITENVTANALYTPNRYTVIFLADESEIASLQTVYGQGLDGALPAIPTKAHYDQMTPVWSITDFAAVTENTTANAVYSPNRYTITFMVGESEIASLETIYGEGLDGMLPEIPTKTGYDQVAPVWSITDFARVTEHTIANAIYTINRYAVTFLAEGATSITREVTHGETLTDIPSVPTRIGYDHASPYWDTTDFANITSDKTVRAVYTPNRYTVTFIADGEEIATLEAIYGVGLNGDLPAIPAKAGYDKMPPAWDITDFSSLTEDATANALYTPNRYKVTFVADGQTVATREVEHGQSLSAIPAIPTKNGYTETAPVWDVTAFDSITTDITVTAVYTQDPSAPQPEPQAPANGEQNGSVKDPYNTSTDKPTNSAKEQGGISPLVILLPILGVLLLGGVILLVLLKKKKS